MIPKLRFSLRTCLVACLTVSLFCTPVVEASNRNRKGNNKKNTTTNASKNAPNKVTEQPTTPTNISPVAATKASTSKSPVANLPAVATKANEIESEHDAFYRKKIQSIIDARSFVPRFLSVLVSKFDKHPMCKIEEIGDECTVYSVLNNLHLSIGSAILSYVVKHYEVPHADYLKILSDNSKEYYDNFQEFENNELDKAVDKMFEEMLAFYSKKTEGEKPEASTETDPNVAEIINIRDNFGEMIRHMLREWVDKVVGVKFVYGFYPENFVDTAAKKEFHDLNGNPALQQFFRDYTNTFYSFFKTYKANSKDANFASALLDSFQPIIKYHLEEIDLLRNILRIDQSNFKAGFDAAVEASKKRSLDKFREDLSKVKSAPAPAGNQPETPVTNGVKSPEAKDIETKEPAPAKESLVVAKDTPKTEEVLVKVEKPTPSTFNKVEEEPKSTTVEKEEPSIIETSATRPLAKRQNQRRTRKTETTEKVPAVDSAVEKAKKDEDEKLLELQRLREEQVKKVLEEKRLKKEEQRKLQEIQRQKAEEERKLQEIQRQKTEEERKAQDDLRLKAEEERKALEKKRKEEEDLIKLEKEKKCLTAIKMLEERAVFNSQGLGTLNFTNVEVIDAFKIVKECKNLSFAIVRPANLSSDEDINKFRVLLEDIWRPTFKASFDVKVAAGSLVSVKNSILKAFKDISKSDTGKLLMARLQSLIIFSNPKREEFINLLVTSNDIDSRLFIENGTLNLPYGSKNITVEQVTILVRNGFEPMPVPQPPSNNGKNSTKTTQQSANSNGKKVASPQPASKAALKNAKAAAPTKAAPVVEKKNTPVTPVPVVAEKPKVLENVSILKKHIEEKKQVIEKPESESVEELTSEPVVAAKPESTPILTPKFISVEELSMRDALLPLDESPKMLSFINKAGFEFTDKVLVRLTVLESLNRIISKHFTGEILLDVYGSTRSLCVLPVSDMDVIVLHRNTGDGRELLPKVHQVLREYNEDKQQFYLCDVDVEAVGRFNSFIGSNKIREQIEPISGFFNILEVREQQGFGMLTLILECTSNYTAGKTVTLEMDLNLHEQPIPGHGSLNEVANLPLNQQSHFYAIHRHGEGVPKISGLFGLTNIFEQIEIAKCSPQTFLNLVRVVKSWSVSRRIYSSLGGYLSSTSIMVTCAKVVQEQIKLGRAMTLDALVFSYFEYMSNSFAGARDFINIVPLTPLELKDLKSHSRNSFCSLFACIINPVFVVAGSSVVNSKMSISSHRMISIEILRALDILKSSADLQHLWEPITKQEQAMSMLKSLNKNLATPRKGPKPIPFTMSTFEVTLPEGNNLTAKAQQAVWSRMESQLFLFGKNGDGTEKYTEHLRHQAFLLVDITEVVTLANQQPKYVFFLFTKTSKIKNEFAVVVTSTNTKRFMQDYSTPILSSDNKDLEDHLLNAWSLLSGESSSASSTPSPYSPPAHFSPGYNSPSPSYGPLPNWPQGYPAYGYDMMGNLVQLPQYGLSEGYQPF